MRDYFDIGVIGYGEKVRSAFDGVLSNRDIVPLSDVAKYRTNWEAAFPVRFSPVAEGDTLMCAALKHAYQILENWVQKTPQFISPDRY